MRTAPERWHGFAVALALGLSACQRTPKSTGDRGAPSVSAVLAEFGGHRITVSDFEDRLAALPPKLRAQYASPDARSRLLEEMVRLELLANEAKRRGFDRSPEVRVRIEEILVEEMMGRLFLTNERPAPISATDVREYYDAHSAEFHVPEERRALAILAAHRAGTDALLKRAAEHPRDETFFRKIASDHGDTVIDTGFFSSATSVQPPGGLRDAIFRIDPSTNARPSIILDGDKVYLVMLTGVRPAIVRQLEDVRVLIEERLREERRNRAVAEFTDGLRARAHTLIHAERIPAPPAASATHVDKAATTD